MKKSSGLALALAAIAFVITSGASARASTIGGNGTVSISADGSNSFDGAVATADDNVTCLFQKFTLTADHVTYNRLTHTLVATGHVKVVDHGNTVLGPIITVPDCSVPSPRYIVTKGGATVTLPGM